MEPPIEATIYAPGHVIDSHFNPWIVFASCVASLIGCLLTIEMLHRRVGGLYNKSSWGANAVCGSVMAIIGVWCMHFIGNRAIILGDGDDRIQLVYAPGYSAFSAFLPVIGLSVAFAVAEITSRSHIIHRLALSVTGIAAGASIIAMHYVANVGIKNFNLHCQHRFIAASVVIAISACFMVLTSFYTWREKWISAWPKRVLCAAVLAAGVTSMHFTAATNLRYEVKYFASPADIYSRNVQVIVAGSLCGFGAVMIFCWLLWRQHRGRVLQQTAQKVMLACAIFGPDGRLLVTHEGNLPSREITDKYIHPTFADEFDTRHTVFHWLFRASRNWYTIWNLIPRMKQHLGAQHSDGEEDSGPQSSAFSNRYDAETYSIYSVIFRERFCVAAGSLAEALKIPLARIGVLFDNIIETGTLRQDGKSWRHNTFLNSLRLSNTEQAISIDAYGPGKLLILTREIHPDNVEHFWNAGFRFARYDQINRNLAGIMRMPVANLDVHMGEICRYLNTLAYCGKNGTYLAFFSLVPSVNAKDGFDMIVKKDDKGQLPDLQLFNHDPVEWQIAFFQRLHGLTPEACISLLEAAPGYTDQEKELASDFIKTLRSLGRQLPAAWFAKALFYGETVYGCWSKPLSEGAPATAFYAFVMCADIAYSIDAGSDFTRVPFELFRARHESYGGAPNHFAFTEDMHTEFAHLLPTPSRTGNMISQLFEAFRGEVGSFFHRTSPRHSDNDHDADNAPDTFELLQRPLRDRQPSYMLNNDGEIREEFRDRIIVNSTTTWSSESRVDEIDDASLDGNVTTQISSAIKPPKSTFIEELVKFLKANNASRPEAVQHLME